MKGHLSAVGALLCLAGLALALTRNTIGAPEIAALGAGSALMATSALMQGGRLTSAIQLVKSLLYSFFILVAMVALFGLLLPRLPRVDMTTSSLNTLSELSVAFLGRLDAQVRITAFTYDHQEYTRFFERMRAVNPEFISYRIFNPFSDVDEALRFSDRVFPDDIFVQVGERTRRIRGLDEGAVINAMVAAMRQGPSTVYFLVGHGEFTLQAPQDDARKLRSAAKLVDAVRARQPQLAALNLREAGGVPDDAAVIVALGPTNDLTAEESRLLEAYLRRGGRMILALGLGNLEAGAALAQEHREWIKLATLMGIEMIQGCVIDVTGQRLHGNGYHAVPSFMAGSQPIAPDSPEYAGILFSQSRAMRPMPIAPEGAEASTVLYSSSESYVFATRDLLTAGSQMTVEQSAGTPQPLIVRAERVFATEDGGTVTGRMIAFGSAFPFSDASINEASARLFLSSIDQLQAEERSQLLPIPPRTLPDQAILLSPEQVRFLLILHLLFIPGVLLFGGLGLTMRRRVGE